MNIINPNMLGSIESKAFKGGLSQLSRVANELPKNMNLGSLSFPASDQPKPLTLGAEGTGIARVQFGSLLKSAIERVNKTQLEADRSIARLAAGKEPNIHQTMINLEQADISLRYAMQIRSKLLEAYQEFMRMPV